MSSRLLERLCHVVTVSHVATPANARIAITARTGAGIRATVAVSRSRIPAGYRPRSVGPVVVEPRCGEDRDRVQPGGETCELRPEGEPSLSLQLVEPSGQAGVLGRSDHADVRDLVILAPAAPA